MSSRKRSDPAPSPRFRSDEKILDLLERDARVEGVLMSFGLPCHRCIVAETETLAEGCHPLGLELAAVMERLNALPPLPSP